MGLILDSSVLISSERKGENAYEVLAQIARNVPGQELAISVITMTEIAHGIARANTPQRRDSRQGFLNEIIRALPVHPVTIEVALRAGRLDGECAARGFQIALSDLLIGVTALELGYQVVTHNLQHFQMIPGVEVFSL